MTCAAPPAHTVALPDIIAVGNGLTVTTIETVLSQPLLFVSLTLSVAVPTAVQVIETRLVVPPVIVPLPPVIGVMLH